VTAHRRLPLASTLLLVIATVGCKTTYGDGSDATTVSGSGAETTAAAPATITGTAAELLPQITDEAEGLSRVMIDGGDDQAAAERIDALWQAVRQEVGASRPELLADFEANVGRCATAVRFDRAADADKAARNLRALVDAYLG